MCLEEQTKFCERLGKELEVRRKVKHLTDEQLDNLLLLLRSDDGKLINEGIVRKEYRESNHVD